VQHAFRLRAASRFVPAEQGTELTPLFVADHGASDAAPSAMNGMVGRLGSVAGSVEDMEEPIVVWLTEQDEANLAIIEATGVSREDAIRAAITHMAAECTPVVWALGRSVSTT
jgi:hypothetical protein